MAERKRVSYLVTPLLQIVRWTLADDYQDGQLGRRKDEGGRITGDTLISSFILHPFVLARPRTCPQHTPSLLPLLRSRPGGVHKTSVVRSPGSDKSFLNVRSNVRYAFLACRSRPEKSSLAANDKLKHIGH